MFLKLEQALSSAKTISRSREKTAFISGILKALEDGGFVYTSHKKWLAEGGSGQSVASQKNGPRYTLKRYGVECKAILLSGDDLEQVAESDGIELNESDVIYAMKQGENWAELRNSR